MRGSAQVLAAVVVGAGAAGIIALAPLACVPQTFTYADGSPSDGAGAEAGTDGTDIGTPCANDRACQNQLCRQPRSLLPTTWKLDREVCMKVCCTSQDCPDTFVCIDDANGGSYCVSPSIGNRRVPLGKGTAGVTCNEAGECRSGVCTGGHCLDPCCANTDCGSGTVCRIALYATGVPFSSVTGWACKLPLGPKPNAGACAKDGDCASNLCRGTGTGAGKTCRPPCDTTSDCRAIGLDAGHCRYGDDTDRVRYCEETTTGAGATGSACNGFGVGNQCQSDFCDGTSCADVCGRDCPSNQVCQPAIVGSLSFPYLRCVPRMP